MAGRTVGEVSGPAGNLGGRPVLAPSVHVVVALGLAPFGVVFEQLDAPALNGRDLVPEGFKEGIRKTRGVKRLLREVGNCCSISTAFNLRPYWSCI